MGYMYNDSAIFITGSCALSQSAYVSWGSATGSGTAVGFFQNNNGTLMFKDHSTGSWTELGNTRDLTQVRNAHLVLTDDDVTHGITSVAQTEAYGDFGPIHQTRGGLLINGLSDQDSADARSLALRGISNDTHTDTVATVEIIGAKRSGTSVQALASAETVLEVANHTTALVTVLGAGKVGIGTTSPEHTLSVTGTLGVSGNANFSGSVALGDAAADVTTVTGQLTGSQGASFALPIDITDTRDAVDNSGDTGALKVEGGASIAKRVFIGTDLLVSGSTSFGDAAADVTTITGQLTASQGALFNNDARIADNNKLYFGDLPDAYIVYDEASTDELIISGALGGIDIQAPQGVADALTISSNGDAYLTFQTVSGYTLFNKQAALLDNVKLYFGTGADASIEHRTSDATLVLSASGCNAFLVDLKDNMSTAFRIGEDTNEYMTIVTTNSSEAIKFSEDVHVIDDKKIYFGTGKDMYIMNTGTTGSLSSSTAFDVHIVDDSTNAFTIKDSGTTYFNIDTRAGANNTLSIGATTLIMDDTDSSAQIGRAHIGYDATNSDMAIFAHQDMATQTNFALRQRATGQTELNAAGGQSINFKISSANKALFNSNGHLNLLDDIKIIFGTGEEAFIEYDEDGTDRLNISGSAAGTQLLGDLHISGHITPSSDNAKDLGSSSNRWANVYTADLHLKNDRGDWTIVEEDNYICVVNNKTNKRYKMMLEEMED